MHQPQATFQVCGARVRSLRMDAGMEIADLAREVGITPSYLSRIEVGTATGRMRPARYVRLRAALKTTDSKILIPPEDHPKE
ncbi:helix-turn-helix domain-containing protein [Streptomyces sp. WMMC897]|uniref:helix-turn-helix domain-containing protein n=1 Tax=Streptomyces sp. WMMC897 TaxID=3014782 RepID=UPI0022B72C9C|nr:helix-turn-helix transcriptional regulator [Streptomyces sp. WMMC897]MCZ7413099.1 helix-turn-helix transcriptional regulator [Streptomyces sp. WMMC897]MCZ7413159.1 helix-turn-helix transcriptional regulator [Streptomyces sp. WMMC897]MCZ7415517.1 helix-turn-helix transcriptional regulator [Streptomyces sp. WMMC897]